MLDIQSLVPIVTVLGSIAGFGFWLSGQLNKIKDLIFIQIDKTNLKIDIMEDHLKEKMEYHERQDDKRFNEIHKDFWEYKIENANNVINAKKLADSEHKHG